ncbi:MAG TPA: hypothetical protein VFP12_15300 [Allosphingosinicella sp.]|nr:hypothetical protein [Allosphingosinicella sp.]
MRFSTSLGFIFLLAATLAGKLLAANAAPPPDEALFYRTAAGVAAKADLTPRLGRSKLGPFLHAEAPGCTLVLREATEGSTFAPAYSRLAQAVGPVVYVYRGRTSPDAPNLLATADHQLWRALHRVGIATRRHPVVAVAISPGCEARRFDWSPLASLPA